MKLFGREPALWIALLGQGFLLLGTFGFHWLTNKEAALLVIVINAIAGAWTALSVKPVAPAAFTYAVASIVSLVAAYGVVIPIDTVAAINSFVVSVLVLITRNQVSPQKTTVSSA